MLVNVYTCVSECECVSVHISYKPFSLRLRSLFETVTRGLEILAA